MLTSPRTQHTPWMLYVEDLPINVFLMEKLFEQVPDLRLVVSTSGEQAWETIQHETPTLLMLDLHLPDCYGVDLLQRLRTHPTCKNVPAVAVTAEMQFRCEGTGFLEIWHKPLNVPHVLSRLGHYARDLKVPHGSGRSLPSSHSWSTLAV